MTLFIYFGLGAVEKIHACLTVSMMKSKGTCKKNIHISYGDQFVERKEKMENRKPWKMK